MRSNKRRLQQSASVGELQASMKMEITVPAPADGRVSRVICREGQSASAGQVLVFLQL